MTAHNTQNDFERVMAACRSLFVKKLHDYGAAWRILRATSVTDQILIKAKRIRSIQMTGKALVNEGIEGEFVAIVNYAIVGLVQLELGPSEADDLSASEALQHYDRFANESLALMLRKNHDYGEAWREMRISSMTDLIYMKILRTKQIEDLDGQTLVSEGITANYMDMLNYAVFCLILLGDEENKDQG